MYGKAQGGKFNYTPQGSTGAYRGWKRYLYEGGILMPGVLEWPARIKKPFSTDVPAVTSDYFPTALAAAGIPLPDDRDYDGINLLPLIDRKMKERKGIGFHCRGMQAWVERRYKVIRLASKKHEPKPWELYDLLADPFEEKDLAEGEEKERDEEDGCESWERMRTKAMEAFVKLEFKRAARGFGKAVEKLQIEEEEEEEEEEESREKRNRASLLANLSLALLRGNEKKEALEAAIACEEEDAQWHKGSYRKAETLYALGEFKEAAEAYESAKAKILDYKTEEKNVDAAINELDGKIHASKEKMEELEELKSIDEEANEWK